MNIGNGNCDNRIREKLQSETGASISFALFLFLICAALSAAVLVAGTVAAGRMSNLAESDQRYYTVMSASELIKDMMDNKSVSYIDGKTYECPMNQVDDAKYANGSDASSFAIEMTNALINALADPESTDNPINLTLSVTGIEELSASAEGTVTRTSDDEGRAEIVICNTYGETNEDFDYHPFRMVLTFAAEKRAANPSITRPDTVKDVPEGTEVTWHLVGMATSYDAGSMWRKEN